MSKALYRKYRSRSFEELAGQEHITTTLQRALKSGKISHAYLLTGPKGVGKTSVARILAHEVNGLPYNDDSMHLDIIEIDAASNRRIDEIRELRDKVYIAPTAGKYKVYIIDEVHMLTREAFNALLKTLEEPPAHAIFILATTEVHKLPETIISRTQRFTFKPIDKDILVGHLKDIAKKENIKVEDAALKLIAEHGQGSFRDSISILDQLSNTEGEITEEAVRNMLGLPPKSAVLELSSNLAAAQPQQLLFTLDKLLAQGMSSAAIARELSDYLRKELLKGSGSLWMTTLLRELLNVNTSSSPRDYLEIALLETATKNASQDKLPTPAPKEPSHNNLPSDKENVKELKIKKPSQIITEIKGTDFDISDWPKVVEYAKKHAASLYTALRLSSPEYTNRTLTLYFEFPLHQKKLNQSAQKEIIGKIIEELSGAKIKIDCVLNKEMFKKNAQTAVVKKASPESETRSEDTPIKNISNIFGSVEMLS